MSPEETHPMAPAASTPKLSDAEWADALGGILAQPQRLRVHFQPIVDLRRGIVRGYEALGRFPDSPTTPPSAWFDAAARLGCAGALEAQLLEAALVSRPLIVRNRFISVNLSPSALLSAEVAAVLREHPRLNSIIVELTRQGEPAETGVVRARLDELRMAGAGIAVDDAGPTPDSLDRLVALRPQFVKLDGHLIAGIDSDAGKVKLLEGLSDLAARMDAWIIAKGIETTAELDTLLRLGIPLGQGFALGAPGPAMTDIDAEIARHVRQRSPRMVAAQDLSTLATDSKACEADDLPGAMAAFGFQPALEQVILLDPDARPVAVWTRMAYERGDGPAPVLSMPATTAVSEAARRAMARSLSERFDAVAVLDGEGRYAGVVAIDRLVSALSR
jgi:EAL domain-containing protein (putative c-di-GMP-specific phosphodiesterase class I)